MSRLFKKLVGGGHASKTIVTNNSSNSVNTEEKAGSSILQEQIKYLNQYIKAMARENEILQGRNDDLKMTLE